MVSTQATERQGKDVCDLTRSDRPSASVLWSSTDCKIHTNKTQEGNWTERTGLQMSRFYSHSFADQNIKLEKEKVYGQNMCTSSGSVNRMAHYFLYILTVKYDILSGRERERRRDWGVRKEWRKEEEEAVRREADGKLQLKMVQNVSSSVVVSSHHKSYPLEKLNTLVWYTRPGPARKNKEELLIITWTTVWSHYFNYLARVFELITGHILMRTIWVFRWASWAGWNHTDCCCCLLVKLCLSLLWPRGL